MALPILHHDDYEKQARAELHRWQEQMSARPGLWSHATRGLQRRINGLIPERVHETVTTIIKQMTRAVIAGSNFTAPAPVHGRTLAQREVLVGEKIENYSRTAAIEASFASTALVVADVTGAAGTVIGTVGLALA